MCHSPGVLRSSTIEPPQMLLTPVVGSGYPESAASASGRKSGYWQTLPVQPTSQSHIVVVGLRAWPSRPRPTLAQTPFRLQFRSEVQRGGGGGGGRGGPGGAGGWPSIPVTNPREIGPTTPSAPKRKQAGRNDGACGCHVNRRQLGCAEQAVQHSATVMSACLIFCSAVEFYIAEGGGGRLREKRCVCVCGGGHLQARLIGS